MNFRQLHAQAEPLVIANVWNVTSAQAAEKYGFQAIGTSSSAIAASLGYDDGQQMSFSELEYIVKRIAENTNLPLSVDLEAGYSLQPSTIAEHIRRLCELGVVGINIEDSLKTDKRRLVKTDEFTQRLTKVKNLLKDSQHHPFINVRTDAFLLGQSNALSTTIERISLYEIVADGIFIPGLVDQKSIQAIAACSSLPLNVMYLPQLPDLHTLKMLGVKRISMGNALFESTYHQLESMMDDIVCGRLIGSITSAQNHRQNKTNAMDTRFKIKALDHTQFEYLFELSNAELSQLGIVRMNADSKPGYPCRVSLEDAEIGEEVILVAHEFHKTTSPYRDKGPIFIRKGTKTKKLEANAIPNMLSHRLLSFRGYDKHGMMIKAITEEGTRTKDTIVQIFSTEEVAYIHIHNAGPGCYNCTVERCTE